MFEPNIIIFEPKEDYKAKRVNTIVQVLKIYNALYVEYKMLHDEFGYRNQFLIDVVVSILGCDTILCDDVIGLIVEYVTDTKIKKVPRSYGRLK